MSILLKELTEILRIHWKPFEEKDMILKSAWHNFKPMVADYTATEVSIVESYSTFEDLGMDSLDFVELIMYVEEEYNVELPDDKVEDIKTIGGLHILLIRTLEGKREAEVTHRDTEHKRASSPFRHPCSTTTVLFCPTCGRKIS
jgi:acyl carrier protein